MSYEKIYFIFSFVILTIVWSIFFILNPSIILDSSEKSVEFDNPKISISSNGRILSFKHDKKEYLVLCAYLHDGKRTFCDENNPVITKIDGKYFETRLDKNRKTKDLIVSKITYQKDNEDLDFTVSDTQQRRWIKSLEFFNKDLILFLIVGSYFALAVYFARNKFSK